MSKLLNNSQVLNQSQSILEAQKSADKYEIIIHSLFHKDNKENIDRHLLILEKWLRESEEG